jgi:hypothetical protein
MLIRSLLVETNSHVPPSWGQSDDCCSWEESEFYEHRGICPPYNVVHSQPSDRHRRAEIEPRHF